MTTTEAKAPRTAESLLRKIEAMPSEAYKIKAIADALREAAAAPPEPPLDVERWMADAAVELQRFTDIIEGRHEAKLQPPHGQTSNRPRQLLERYARG